MLVISRGFVHQDQVTNAVAEAAKTLDAREVRDVRFGLETDSGGEPAIFFGVLLTPYGSHKSRLTDVTWRVSTALADQLQPYNQWGLLPYFAFTANRAHHRSPDWM